MDVDEIRAYAIFQGKYYEQHRVVMWLWHVVREFDNNLRGAFLKFVTGSTRLPLDGYDPPFNITEGADMDLKSLPKAHTCFNQLVLPRYASLEILQQKLKHGLRLKMR